MLLDSAPMASLSLAHNSRLERPAEPGTLKLAETQTGSPEKLELPNALRAFAKKINVEVLNTINESNSTNAQVSKLGRPDLIVSTVGLYLSHIWISYCAPMAGLFLSETMPRRIAVNLLVTTAFERAFDQEKICGNETHRIEGFLQGFVDRLVQDPDIRIDPKVAEQIIRGFLLNKAYGMGAKIRLALGMQPKLESKFDDFDDSVLSDASFTPRSTLQHCTLAPSTVQRFTLQQRFANRPNEAESKMSPAEPRLRGASAPQTSRAIESRDSREKGKQSVAKVPARTAPVESSATLAKADTGRLANPATPETKVSDISELRVPGKDSASHTTGRKPDLREATLPAPLPPAPKRATVITIRPSPAPDLRDLVISPGFGRPIGDGRIAPRLRTTSASADQFISASLQNVAKKQGELITALRDLKIPTDTIVNLKKSSLHLVERVLATESDSTVTITKKQIWHLPEAACKLFQAYYEQLRENTATQKIFFSRYPFIFFQLTPTPAPIQIKLDEQLIS